ncbi:hypothetical protein SCACP_05490 [Sporomusa carbonis]|uniref:tetratricopeptide repeat protein n=1 Tax=Sporomusa carbonis TaxID=3076075 RepID=UPI003A5E7DB5
MVNQAHQHISMKDFDAAEQALHPALSLADEFREKYGQTQFCFNNGLELVFYIMLDEPDFGLASRNIPFSNVFQTYGFILMEKGRLDDALNMLDKGLLFNPVDAALHFEKAEVLKAQRRTSELWEQIETCFEVSYLPHYIARAYRNYGYYFIEAREWEAAACCYFASQRWEHHIMAQGQLAYIRSAAGKPYQEKDYPPDVIDAILSKRQVPVKPCPLWPAAAIRVGADILSENPANALMYFEIAYRLCPDRHIQAMIIKAKQKVQRQKMDDKTIIASHSESGQS